jgi:DNA end-binding protein Ku
MVLQALLWPDEVREAAFPVLEDTEVKISDKELKMSSSLVESLSSDFEPEQFTDEYQTQLTQLVEAKLAKGDAVDTEETFGAPAEEGEGAEVLDLMEALRRSVESRRKAAGGAKESSGAKSSAGTRSRAKKADDAEGAPQEEKAPPKRRTRKTG